MEKSKIKNQISKTQVKTKKYSLSNFRFYILFVFLIFVPIP